MPELPEAEATRRHIEAPPPAHAAPTGLGPDAPEIGVEVFGGRVFAARVGGERGAIEPVPLDQGNTVGIGTNGSDWILLHTEVSSGAHGLSETATRTMHDRTVHLLTRRVADFPRARCRGTIRNKTVGGRAAHFCDTHQKAA
ncbi:hypothetical protein P6F26_06855 [Roseibacterium sp. SDUM158017]|uniref:hypothetical protein n=1 Tax=Roseicyclus salinarum TaxID=3036773 RepID=UPI002415190A|nr:hypothetical protein [Roseibacterium sp. SDUM158017]MDG4648157.1 hypothetical protein [Roseibacterium sp. SDUM158017]